MLKIRFKDGKEYNVLSNTAIYPSYNTNSRNKFEIHMEESSMSLEEFELLFNEDNTSEIHLINDESGSDVAYFDYIILSSVGKKLITTQNISTNELVKNLELVAELEQITYIEKQLKQLNIEI